MTLVTPHPSIRLIGQALEARGYTVQSFEIDESSYTRFIAPNGDTWVTQDAHISYPFLNATCQKISHHKSLAYEMCNAAGIRVPKTVSFERVSEERQALTNLLEQGPVVVKPNNSSLSWGVTLNVRTRQGLEDAVEEALKYSTKAIAQEQVEGEEIRFAVINGKVRAALLRQNPRVVGDGVHTVAELIETENKLRQDLHLQYLSYPQLDNRILDLTSVNLKSVPASEEVINLSRATMIKGGASIYNIISDIHESYVRIAEEAAALLSHKFMVVDIMIKDYTQKAHSNNYAFIEYNTAPVLKLFYSCRDGKQFDVISELVPIIDFAVQGENQ